MSTDKIEGGYVLQPRKLDESEIMKHPPVVRELWQYLCRKVNWRDTKVCARGEGFFHFEDIQNDLCWFAGYRKMTYSKPQITKSLRRLREVNAIATAKATRGLRVKVLNYSHYQDPNNYEGNDEEITKETRRQRCGITIPEEGEEGKKENKNIGSRFTPPSASEWVAYASEIGFPKPDAEAAFDHYTANGWKVGGKATMKDWKAAARNCKRRGNFNNPNQTAYGKTVSNSQRDRGTLNAGAADRYADGEVESLFG